MCTCSDILGHPPHPPSSPFTLARFFCNWFSPREMSNYAMWDSALLSILEAWTPTPLSQAQVDALFYETAARVYRVHVGSTRQSIAHASNIATL